MLARLAHGYTSVEVIVKDKRRRERQHTCKSVPGNDPYIQRQREGRLILTSSGVVRDWGPFLEGPKTFSYPESRSKISNLMIT